MTKIDEPVRWLDDPQDLPDELVKGLPRYADIAPSAELHARMFEAIERDLTVSPTTDAGALDRGLLASSKLKLMMAGALALVLSGGYALQSAEAPREPSVSPRVADAAAAKVVEAPAKVAVEANGPQVPLQVAPVDAGVQKLPVSEGVRRALKTRAHQPTETAVLDPQAELSLLSRARRVLPGSPSRALELTREHAEKFAQGMFAQEREVLAIEALVKLGRASEAQARASAFERTHPGSTHLERIRVILSGP